MVTAIMVQMNLTCNNIVYVNYPYQKVILVTEVSYFTKISNALWSGSLNPNFL